MHNKKRVLVVDGYNLLGAWHNRMATYRGIDDARDALTARLHEYAGYTGERVIVVYDAWLSDRGVRTVETAKNFSVVFTKKGETADQYIERLVDGMKRDVELDRLEVRVATSDMVEQTVVLGRGAARVSARELLAEIEHTLASGAAHVAQTPVRARATVMDGLSAATLEKLRQFKAGGMGD